MRDDKNIVEFYIWLEERHCCRLTYYSVAHVPENRNRAKGLRNMRRIYIRDWTCVRKWNIRSWSINRHCLFGTDQDQINYIHGQHQHTCFCTKSTQSDEILASILPLWVSIETCLLVTFTRDVSIVMCLDFDLRGLFRGEEHGAWKFGFVWEFLTFLTTYCNCFRQELFNIVNSKFFYEPLLLLAMSVNQLRIDGNTNSCRDTIKSINFEVRFLELHVKLAF